MITFTLVPRKNTTPNGSDFVEMIEVRDESGMPRAIMHVDDFYVPRNDPNNEVYDQLNAGETVKVEVSLLRGDTLY